MPAAGVGGGLSAAPIADEGIGSSGEQLLAALWVADMLGSEKNRCLFFVASSGS